MKKILSACLVLAMVLTLGVVLAGCGGGDGIVGTWDGGAFYLEFNEDSTGAVVIPGHGYGSFDWAVENGTLTMTFDNEDEPTIYEYSVRRSTLSLGDSEFSRVNARSNADEELPAFVEMMSGIWFRQGNEDIGLELDADGTGSYIRGQGVRVNWSLAWTAHGGLSVTFADAGGAREYEGSVIGGDRLRILAAIAGESLEVYIKQTDAEIATLLSEREAEQAAAQTAERLVGSWHWNNRPWYVFRANGTGQRPNASGGQETFRWNVNRGFLEIQVSGITEQWNYSFNATGNRLTLTSRQVSSISYTYTRR